MNPEPSDYQLLSLPLSYQDKLKKEVSQAVVVLLVLVYHKNQILGSKIFSIIDHLIKEFTMHKIIWYRGHLSDLLFFWRMKKRFRDYWKGNMQSYYDLSGLFQMLIYDSKISWQMLMLYLMSAFCRGKLWEFYDFHFNAVIWCFDLSKIDRG